MSISRGFQVLNYSIGCVKVKFIESKWGKRFKPKEVKVPKEVKLL